MMPTEPATESAPKPEAYLPNEWRAEKILEVYGNPTEPEFSTRLGQAIVTSCTNPNPTPNTSRMTIGSYDKAIAALDSLEKTPQVAIAKYRLGIEKARLSNSSNPFPNHETEYAAAHAASQTLDSGYDIKQFNPTLSNSIAFSAVTVGSVSSEAITDFRLRTGTAHSWSQDFKTIEPGAVSESDDKLKKLLEKSPQATAKQWKEYHEQFIKGKKDFAIKADIMDRVEYSNPDEPPQNHYVHHLEGLEVTTFEKWAEAAKTSAEYKELTDAIYSAADTSNNKSTMNPNTHPASLQERQLDTFDKWSKVAKTSGDYEKLTSEISKAMQMDNVTPEHLASFQKKQFDTFKQWPESARNSTEDQLKFNRCIQSAINTYPSVNTGVNTISQLEALKTTSNLTSDETAATTTSPAATTTTPDPTPDQPAVNVETSATTAATNKRKARTVSFAPDAQVLDFDKDNEATTVGTQRHEAVTTPVVDADVPVDDTAATSTDTAATSTATAVNAASVPATGGTTPPVPVDDTATPTTSTDATSTDTDATSTDPADEAAATASLSATITPGGGDPVRAEIRAADGPNLPYLEAQCNRYIVMHPNIRDLDEEAGCKKVKDIFDKGNITDKDIKFIQKIMMESLKEESHSKLQEFTKNNIRLLDSETAAFKEALKQKSELNEELSAAIIADLQYKDTDYQVDYTLSSEQKAPKWVKDRNKAIHKRFGIRRFTGNTLEKGKSPVIEKLLFDFGYNWRKNGISFTINDNGSVSIPPLGPQSLARSLVAAIMAQGKLGEPVNIALKAVDPYQAQEEISALIEEAHKKGIPLDTITVSAPNIENDFTLAEMVERRANDEGSGFQDKNHPNRDASRYGYPGSSSEGIISKKRCKEIASAGGTLSTNGHPYRNQNDGALYLSEESQKERTKVLKDAFVASDDGFIVEPGCDIGNVGDWLVTDNNGAQKSVDYKVTEKFMKLSKDERRFVVRKLQERDIPKIKNIIHNQTRHYKKTYKNTTEDPKPKEIKAQQDILGYNSLLKTLENTNNLVNINDPNEVVSSHGFIGAGDAENAKAFRSAITGTSTNPRASNTDKISAFSETLAAQRNAALEASDRASSAVGTASTAEEAAAPPAAPPVTPS